MAERDDLASAVLKSLAEDRRRVAAIWRVWILLQRLSVQRKQAAPNRNRSRAVIRRLVERQDLQRVRELKDVYVVTSPYASALPLTEEQILQEANPQGFFSHLTALVHHGLTDVVPGRVYATNVALARRLPLGTSADDWVEVPLPAGQTPDSIGGIPVIWSSAEDDRGVIAAYSQGSSIYISDVEWTLLDCLKDPGKAHGITTVLMAWKEASETWDLDRLLQYADQGPVMRQRVGYLVECLGQGHEILREWKTRLQRGGSLKLVASAPYSPVFSPEWNLSLNVPESVLAVLGE